MTSAFPGGRQHCIRCGECCSRSTPSLHLQDLALLERGILPLNALYTVRKGEAVWDNVEKRIAVSDREMIKVKERREGEGCAFYDGAQGCRIYAHRPAQCSALRCWDPSEFMDVHRSPKLERFHVFPPGALLGLVTEHEKRCSYEELEVLVARIRGDGEGPVQEILKMLQFDFNLRPLSSKKLGMDEREMDLLFGRPLVRTIRRFGLTVIRQSDTFLLTTLEPSGDEA